MYNKLLLSVCIAVVQLIHNAASKYILVFMTYSILYNLFNCVPSEFVGSGQTSFDVSFQQIRCGSDDLYVSSSFRNCPDIGIVTIYSLYLFYFIPQSHGTP